MCASGKHDWDWGDLYVRDDADQQRYDHFSCGFLGCGATTRVPSGDVPPKEQTAGILGDASLYYGSGAKTSRGGPRPSPRMVASWKRCLEDWEREKQQILRGAKEGR